MRVGERRRRPLTGRAPPLRRLLRNVVESVRQRVPLLRRRLRVAIRILRLRRLIGIRTLRAGILRLRIRILLRAGILRVRRIGRVPRRLIRRRRLIKGAGRAESGEDFVNNGVGFRSQSGGSESRLDGVGYLLDLLRTRIGGALRDRSAQIYRVRREVAEYRLNDVAVLIRRSSRRRRR